MERGSSLEMLPGVTEPLMKCALESIILPKSSKQLSVALLCFLSISCLSQKHKENDKKPIKTIAAKLESFEEIKFPVSSSKYNLPAEVIFILKVSKEGHIKKARLKKKARALFDEYAFRELTKLKFKPDSLDKSALFNYVELRFLFHKNEINGKEEIAVSVLNYIPK